MRGASQATVRNFANERNDRVEKKKEKARE
jgi:hypothetical protein